MKFDYLENLFPTRQEQQLFNTVLDRARTRLPTAEFAILLAGMQLLHDSATIDPKTGLLNPLGLEKAITRIDAKQRPAYTDGSTRVLSYDLDHLKVANAAYGEEEVDRKILPATGELIVSHFKETDIHARFGGDEFLTILPRFEGTDAKLQERLDAFCKGYRAAIKQYDPRGIVGISIGAATLEHNISFDEARKRASDARTYAKLEKNRASLYDPAIDYEAVRERIKNRGRVLMQLS